jgi:spermidine synthase
MSSCAHSAATNRPARSWQAASAALLLIGFSAVIGQIVLLRELISVYNVSESSLGVMLAAWLFWTAAGSFIFARLAPNQRNTRHMAAALECLLGVSLPLTLWALRASKSLFQTVPGELVGPLPVLLVSFACLSLFCMSAGALFVIAARMICNEDHPDARQAISRAYLLEAAGSAAGGIIVSLILLPIFSPFQIAGLVLTVNLLMACILLLRLKPLQLATVIAATALLLVFLLAAVAPRLERQSQAELWRGFHLLAVRNSICGNLALIESGEMRSLYENGLILASAPDESAAEESVHYALLEHPDPRKVLLIGGGANGSVAQALRHPSVERIDLVELNPDLLRMANEFFPTAAAPSDLRVHLHYGDGRAFLNDSPLSYDAILVNTPDPQTAQLNRFYTAEFFLSTRNHLAPDGLFALELRSSEEVISPDLADFLRCIQHTLQQVYPAVVVIPGETIHFFAAKRLGVLTDDPQMLMARLQTRNLKTLYVSRYFIPYRMMPDRMEQVRTQLQPLPTTPVNRDFSPIAYYFNAVLWSAQFKPAYADWLRLAGRIPFTRIFGSLLIVLMAVVALLSILADREQRARAAAACSMAATGFTLMGLEILLLLAFQSLFGYLYRQLAILIALFMTGIAVGSWLALRRMRRSTAPVCLTSALTQLLLALAAPLLMAVISLAGKYSGTAASWLAAHGLFPVLAVLCGILGGLQFPVATQLSIADKRQSLGLLYAIDLLGGCWGALVLSGYLIPVFGFWPTAWLIATVNLAPVLLLLRLSFFRRRPA